MDTRKTNQLEKLNKDVFSVLFLYFNPQDILNFVRLSKFCRDMFYAKQIEADSLLLDETRKHQHVAYGYLLGEIKNNRSKEKTLFLLKKTFDCLHPKNIKISDDMKHIVERSIDKGDKVMEFCFGIPKEKFNTQAFSKWQAQKTQEGRAKVHLLNNPGPGSKFGFGLFTQNELIKFINENAESGCIKSIEKCPKIRYS